MGNPIDLLILAAHPLELEGLHAILGAGLRGYVHDVAVAAAEVGVGLAAAGAGAMQRLLVERPRRALLLGSYGRYPSRSGFVPGQLLVPTRVELLDAAVLAGQAAFPAPMALLAEPDLALSNGLANAAAEVTRGALATTLGITQDDALARKLGANSGCMAENLEALAVGLACASSAVPWSALLGCTNAVGSQGRAQWAANHPLAASITGAHVVAWLAQERLVFEFVANDPRVLP